MAGQMPRHLRGSASLTAATSPACCQLQPHPLGQPPHPSNARKHCGLYHALPLKTLPSVLTVFLPCLPRKSRPLPSEAQCMCQAAPSSPRNRPLPLSRHPHPRTFRCRPAPRAAPERRRGISRHLSAQRRTACYSNASLRARLASWIFLARSSVPSNSSSTSLSTGASRIL
jgi:hypothetical protein